MGQAITLTAEDGQKIGAYRADPAGTPRGGIVVIQEIFGVNGHVRSVCDGYAEKGYAAIAPALFDRAKPDVELAYNPDDAAIGFELRAAVGWDDPLKDIAAAAQELKGAGKVGAVGYCWGGSLAWLSNTRLGLPAVGYYGGQISQFMDEKPKSPMMLHFGETDAHIPMADVEKIHAAHPDVPLFTYPAGHGFNCDLRPDFHAESAATALERSLGFFAEQIG